MRPADRAWIALGVGVLGWDACCERHEMLSDASARYTKAHPILWGGTVIYVAGHLVHIWGKWDPLSVLARALGR